MTLPRNFPGRINDRRASVLKRIERQIASGVKANNGYETPLTAGDFTRLGKEADTLATRIRPANVARAVRTKKNRTGTGKFARPT